MTCHLTINNPSISARFLDTTVNQRSRQTDSPHLYKRLSHDEKEACYEEFSSNDHKRSFDIILVYTNEIYR